MAIWRGLLAVCLVLVQACLAHAADSPADQAIYAARFRALMSGHGGYDTPTEPVAGAPGAAPLPRASSPSIAPAALAAAAAYADANRSRALLVWQGGRLQDARYFRGADAHTLLTAKSLAKPLTAIVIGRAIALGRIRALDEPASDFIAEWRNTPKAAILISQLLDMTSGLLGQRPATDPSDIMNRAYLDPHHDALLIHDYPLIHAPGTRFDYGNAQAEIIAIVIERATGQRYAAFVAQHVLQPLGAEGGVVWIDRPGGLAHSGCCILLPAETWLRLAILLMQDGIWQGHRLLPRGYVARMLRPGAIYPPYGLGIYVATPYSPSRGLGNPDPPAPMVLQGAPYLARDLFKFDGFTDQTADIVPSQRLIVLRMGDQPPPHPGWDNAMLPNLILRGMAHPAAGTTPQPRR